MTVSRSVLIDADVEHVLCRRRGPGRSRDSRMAGEMGREAMRPHADLGLVGVAFNSVSKYYDIQNFTLCNQ